MIARSDGLLLVNKPAGISSGKLVSCLKRKFAWKKVGHGGTLDPFADGLMAILVGEATKVSRFLLGGTKSYVAVAAIGQETDTGDTEGVLSGPVSLVRPSLEDWKKAASQFIGETEQVPPMYAAIKHQGKALYKLARAGVVVERTPRKIEIESLSITEVRDDLLTFSVRCAGGTYIRVLTEDLAKAAGTRAHLCKLTRTDTKHFSLKQAYDFDELMNYSPNVRPELLAIEAILPHINHVPCSDACASRVAVGDLEAVNFAINQSKENVTTDGPESEYTLLTKTPKDGHELSALALARFSLESQKHVLERVFV